MLNTKCPVIKERPPKDRDYTKTKYLFVRLEMLDANCQIYAAVFTVMREVQITL